MPKPPTSIHRCSKCGYQQARWFGKCPQCQAFASGEEEAAPPAGQRGGGGGASGGGSQGWGARRTGATAVPLSSRQATALTRWGTGLPDFDQLLGGGLVPGGILLLSGEPGIGKSTICLQLAGFSEQQGRSVLYVSGEESMDQVAARAGRLGQGSQDVLFLGETDLDAIEAELDRRPPSLLIADSIQTLYDSGSTGQPGQVAQLRGAATRLQRLAKDRNIATVVIGHVTKDGQMAGPKMLEHVVDATAHFTHAGDGEHRLVRTYKNRFGTSGELAVFRMTEQGLVTVADPSSLFLADRPRGVSGSAVTVILEGTRAVALEIQALVTPAGFGTPQRVALGFPRTRLSVLVALLEKRLGLQLSTMDVFLNVVGGLTIEDPGVDAAVAAAICSSAADIALPFQTVIFGELGLGGELRRTSSVERRLAEAQRLGFQEAIVAGSQTPPGAPPKPALRPTADLGALVQQVLPSWRRSRKSAGGSGGSRPSAGGGRGSGGGGATSRPGSAVAERRDDGDEDAPDLIELDGPPGL